MDELRSCIAMAKCSRRGNADMTTSIFCKSWRGDRFHLDYLLRSLKKQASGFLETVVLLPEMDSAHFLGVEFHGATAKWVKEEEGKNYLRQQSYKLHADEYCSGDRILFIDSDCFFFAPISPEIYAPTGKPISLIRHWAESGSGILWKPITEKFLGFEPVFDGMPALPFIVDRRVLPMIREYATATHGCSIKEYILSQPGNDFSEFNALSAWSHRFTPYLYDFRIADPEKDGFPRHHWQRHSWSQSADQFKDEYERILAA